MMRRGENGLDALAAICRGEGSNLALAIARYIKPEQLSLAKLLELLADEDPNVKNVARILLKRVRVMGRDLGALLAERKSGCSEVRCIVKGLIWRIPSDEMEEDVILEAIREEDERVSDLVWDLSRCIHNDKLSLESLIGLMNSTQKEGQGAAKEMLRRFSPRGEHMERLIELRAAENPAIRSVAAVVARRILAEELDVKRLLEMQEEKYDKRCRELARELALKAAPASTIKKWKLNKFRDHPDPRVRRLANELEWLMLTPKKQLSSEHKEFMEMYYGEE